MLFIDKMDLSNSYLDCSSDVLVTKVPYYSGLTDRSL